MQPFNADDSQIKKAYYAIMRECHPDLSQDDESLEFSTIINEIYEVLFVGRLAKQRMSPFVMMSLRGTERVQTLKHPQRRAAYDAIVGLSGDAVNPFTDNSYERDQVRI